MTDTEMTTADGVARRIADAVVGWYDDDTNFGRPVVEAIRPGVADALGAVSGKMHTRHAAEITALCNVLWAIYSLSGGDTDGDQGPGAYIAGMGVEGFAGMVRESVAELRKDYDEALRDGSP